MLCINFCLSHLISRYYGKKTEEIFAHAGIFRSVFTGCNNLDGFLTLKREPRLYIYQAWQILPL